MSGDQVIASMVSNSIGHELTGLLSTMGEGASYPSKIQLTHGRFPEHCTPLRYRNMSLSGERIRSQWVAVSVDS